MNTEPNSTIQSWTASYWTHRREADKTPFEPEEHKRTTLAIVSELSSHVRPSRTSDSPSITPFLTSSGR